MACLEHLSGKEGPRRLQGQFSQPSAVCFGVGCSVSLGPFAWVRNAQSHLIYLICGLWCVSCDKASEHSYMGEIL